MGDSSFYGGVIGCSKFFLVGSLNDLPIARDRAKEAGASNMFPRTHGNA
ncbi:hypothetical protein ACFL17_01980 [Pseudomonadota bacterium]